MGPLYHTGWTCCVASRRLIYADGRPCIAVAGRHDVSHFDCRIRKGESVANAIDDVQIVTIDLPVQSLGWQGEKSTYETNVRRFCKSKHDPVTLSVLQSCLEIKQLLSALSARLERIPCFMKRKRPMGGHVVAEDSFTYAKF